MTDIQNGTYTDIQGVTKTYKDGLYHSYNNQPAIKYSYQSYWYWDGLDHNEYDHHHSEYHPNGFLLERMWYFNGQLHRELPKPALIIYDENGSINEVHYYQYGVEVDVCGKRNNKFSVISSINA
jgi:hypothetical protein